MADTEATAFASGDREWDNAFYRHSWGLSEQHSGDGGLPGKKIALDLQLPDLPVQIVDHLLCILSRRRLVATRKQLGRSFHQLLHPVADHRRMNPKLRRQLRQG